LDTLQLATLAGGKPSFFCSKRGDEVVGFVFFLSFFHSLFNICRIDYYVYFDYQCLQFYRNFIIFMFGSSALTRFLKGRKMFIYEIAIIDGKHLREKCKVGWSGHFSNQVLHILWVLKLLVLISIDTISKIFEIGED
jgi:hypothetical protein